MPTWSDSAGPTLARTLASAVAMVVLAGRGPAAAEGRMPPLLDFCAPPFVPPCVDRLAEHPAERESCTPQMSRYVASVFAYRACLTRETERAVRQSNEAIATFRRAAKPDRP